jgi:hypothetical protein
MNRSAKAFSLFLFLVFSLSGCGKGGSGTPLAASGGPALRQEPVLSVSAVAGSGRVTLDWSSIANATEFAVYSSNSATDPGGIIASVAAPSQEYVDTTVVNGNTYYYIIEALNGTTVIGRSAQVSATPDAPPAVVTISGTMQYQDREYDAGGFTGSESRKAIRYASVELVSGSGVLLSMQTDSTGFFRFTTAPTPTVYVRVLAAAAPPGSPAGIEVNDLAGNLYAVRGNSFVASGNTDITVTVSSTSIGGVFNILDVFTSGFEFDRALSSYPSVTLSSFWQKSSSIGTYYCSGPGEGCSRGQGIYVTNGSNDADEYDDDVLYHEFGHFTAACFSRDDSPGGAHMLTSNDLDLRLAWSEGWGDAMPGNIKRWLLSSNPGLISATGVYPDYLTEYVDTTAHGAGIALNMAAPGGSPYLYASGEVAIAKILLDLNRDYGMQNVWDVVADFRKNPPQTPVNLELFWDRWNDLPGTSSMPISAYFASRQIDYSADPFEPDGDDAFAAPYTPGSPQVHRFYPAGDVDFVSISTLTNQLYTVSTSDLNGADTVVEVYNRNLALVASSDNANGYASWVYAVPSGDPSLGLCDVYHVCHDNRPDVLASSKQFRAAYSGSYYVRIRSSSNKPASAGRYGTYTLSITSP